MRTPRGIIDVDALSERLSGGWAASYRATTPGVVELVESTEAS